MSEIFDKIVKFIFIHETEFVPGHYGNYDFAIAEHDPDDSGGITKFGIDQRAHPDVNIESLNYDQAKKIYMNDYYLKLKIDTFPEKLQLIAVNISVVSGFFQMAKFLQRALGVTDDGIIGKMTMAALKEADVVRVGHSMIAQYDAFYRKLAVTRPKDAKYLAGWLNRNKDLKQAFDSNLYV